MVQRAQQQAPLRQTCIAAAAWYRLPSRRASDAPRVRSNRLVQRATQQRQKRKRKRKQKKKQQQQKQLQKQKQKQKRKRKRKQQQKQALVEKSTLAA